jgi:Cu/Ag efflux pump CusA
LRNVEGPPSGLLGKLMRFCLENKLVVGLFVIIVIVWGVLVAPFDWELGCCLERPCLMITAMTILALIPVLTFTGRGSDIMMPMAIASFGGMSIEMLTMLVVPILYCAVRELRLKHTA